MTASGAIYRLGLALLDLENPTQVIYRSDEWIFQPQEDYERFGDVDKVVFPCGWVEQDGQVRIYYGGADSCIALAVSKSLAYGTGRDTDQESANQMAMNICSGYAGDCSIVAETCSND